MIPIILPTTRIELLQFLSSELFTNIIAYPSKYSLSNSSFQQFIQLRECELTTIDEIKIALLIFITGNHTFLQHLHHESNISHTLQHLLPFFTLHFLLLTYIYHPEKIPELLLFQKENTCPQMVMNSDPSLDLFLDVFDKANDVTKSDITQCVNQFLITQFKALSLHPEDSTNTLIFTTWSFIFEINKKHNPILIQFLTTLPETKQTLFFDFLLESFNFKVLDFLAKKDKTANSVIRHNETLKTLFSSPFLSSLVYKNKILSFYSFCDFTQHRQTNPEYFSI